MKLLIVSVLVGLMVGVSPAAERVSTPHQPVNTVQQADWLLDEVVTLTYANGDVTTYAPNRGALFFSGTISTEPYGNASILEVCRVTWQSGDVTVEVVVPQKAGEKSDDWAKRCLDRVQAMQAVFPPNQPGT